MANFRQEHLDALAGLLVQALRLCQKAGLVKLGNVAIDGTKIMANASTRRSVSYQKISDREQYWQNEVQRLLKQAQQTDQQEDQLFGQGQPVSVLSDELANAQSRLQRLKQAKAELEQEAQKQLQDATTNLIFGKRGRQSNVERASRSVKDRQQREKEKKQRRRAKRNAQQPSRQYNLVDKD